MIMNIWPLTERPREKLLTHGAATLSDAELLAIFLRIGCPGKTAVDIARDLLKHFGSLRALFNCSQEEFCQFPGLGKVKYVQLQAIAEIGTRYLNERLKKEMVFSQHRDTERFLIAKLRHLQHEVFACIFLDTKNQLLTYEEITQGTHNEARVYPREIVKRALRHNAAAVILAHNHPSGICEASQDDKILTKKIKEALALVDIDVYDHLIIGDGQICSFAQRGWL